MKYVTKRVRQEAYRALERITLNGTPEEQAIAEKRMVYLRIDRLSKDEIFELAAKEREFVSLNR